MNTPIKREIVDGLIQEFGIQDFAKATIREVKRVAQFAEEKSGVEFIKMDSSSRLRALSRPSSASTSIPRAACPR